LFVDLLDLSDDDFDAARFADCGGSSPNKISSRLAAALFRMSSSCATHIGTVSSSDRKQPRASSAMLRVVYCGPNPLEVR
jgi:hypothetical protein